MANASNRLCLFLVPLFAHAAMHAGTVPELACVNTRVFVAYEGGHQLVEVELTNNCRKDIVAFSLGLSNSSDETDLAGFHASFDYLHTLRMNPGQRRDRFDVVDILRAGSSISIQLRDLQGGLAQPTGAHLSSAIFSDYSAVGDPKPINERLYYWRADLRSLRRALEAINKAPSLETARTQFPPGSCGPQPNTLAPRVTAEESLFVGLCDNLVHYANAKATTTQSWKEFIARFKAHIEKGVRVYTDYVERVPAGSSTVKGEK